MDILGMVDVTNIVQGVVLILVAVVTGFLIPYIKKKTNLEDYNGIMFWVKLAVQAAEQIYNKDGQGEIKKEYVLHYLESKGLHIDENSLDSMIESAVYEINNAAKRDE